MFKFFDLHADTPYECYSKNIALNSKELAVNTYIKSPFLLHKQCFAIWIRDDQPDAFLLYKNILSRFKTELLKNNGSIIPILTVEGGAVIDDKPERLYSLYEDGIKALTLTWNGKNRIASGAFEDGGLTPFGCDVIGVMNELSMICDLSHLNSKSFFDALKVTDHPIVTHTCCAAVNPHPRNIDDDAIKAVCEKGGIIGVCLYPAFLGGEDVFKAVLEHIYHILCLGFENNIAIGSDFDGACMDSRLRDISMIPLLYDYLLENGLCENTLNKIFFKNADNFFSNL